MKTYKCDRCGSETEPKESQVLNKQYHVPPSGCFEGDYYVSQYFYFKCDCGRAIAVDEKDLTNPYSLPEDFTPHVSVSRNCER